MNSQDGKAAEAANYLVRTVKGMPKRPGLLGPMVTGKRVKTLHFGIKSTSDYVDQAESYMDALEARIREARSIIEQYPRMVRNILGQKPVRNVEELEGHAQSWLEKYHE